MTNGKLFTLDSNGQFSRSGDAKLSFISEMRLGGKIAFKLDCSGNENDIMAMVYSAMEGRPEISKLMLTVFYKFCIDKGISPAQLPGHTYYGSAGIK